ncbi:MAG TPA: DUF58 domain-containing protein [Bacillus sp. (in: firmicutes)]|uniref:DUF58 domain-containing protein n=1 Tax=Bacillus litorisediminis TaxID=2922713 RepID=UPI001FAC98CB|nr:DUF58 domain-containing protein [Bacillus litorisediminis]HWO78592.1 DUF58 domain-containing protein [Bacillus sp. (in: firmicutes)]
MWNRVQSEDQYAKSIVTVFFFFALFSIYFQTATGLIISVAVMLILIGQSLYLKYSGAGLVFINKKERQYFYKEDTGTFELEFVNQGLPILSATVRLQLDPIVDPIMDEEMKLQRVRYGKTLLEIELPFSIARNQTMKIKLPFTATKRGLARIKKIDIVIPHPFGLGEVTLNLKQIVKRDAVIFPVSRKITNDLSFSTLKEGANVQLHSLFEDLLSPIGTRDYEIGDSFKRINWKASARKQVLQSKMYEKTSEHSVLLSFNIHEFYSITSSLDEVIEKMAYLARLFYEHQIAYGIAVNLRTFGPVPFLFIPKGTGRDHLFKVLEALALIDYQMVTTPYEKVQVYLLQNQGTEIMNWIHFGTAGERHIAVFKRAAQKGVHLFQLCSKNEQLIPFQFNSLEREAPING